MFGKIRCPFCNNKIDKKFQFCPYCGKNLKSGEDKFFQPTFNLGFPFNAIVKQLEKQMESQFNEVDKELGEFKMKEYQKPKKMQGISISISQSGEGKPVIKVSNLGDNERVIKEEPSFSETSMSEKDIEKRSKLPKHDPSTNVRRLTDKIVYEIDVPGVKKEDIMITKLHNSIEIKAYAKDKAYFKLLPISLPILRSQLKDGKLILELKPR